jgi:hypothetical protein
MTIHEMSDTKLFGVLQAFAFCVWQFDRMLVARTDMSDGERAKARRDRDDCRMRYEVLRKELEARGYRVH